MGVYRFCHEFDARGKGSLLWHRNAMEMGEMEGFGNFVNYVLKGAFGSEARVILKVTLFLFLGLDFDYYLDYIAVMLLKKDYALGKNAE